MHKKNHLKKFILISFLFFITKMHSIDPRHIGASICLAGGIHNCINMWQQTPYLYKQTNSFGCYLDLVEARINELESVMEIRTHEELIEFKYELYKYYEKILNNRSWCSTIFQRDIPVQSLALLDEELTQHLFNLQMCRTQFDSECDSDNPSIEVLKINSFEKKIHEIKCYLDCLVEYQTECSLARQEKKISAVFHYVAALFFFYIAHYQIDSLSRYPQWD